MKLVNILICGAIIGCSTPTAENRCCTDGTCLSCLWYEKAECLERYSDKLERELTIIKVKMQYECKEAK